MSLKHKENSSAIDDSQSKARTFFSVEIRWSYSYCVQNILSNRHVALHRDRGDTKQEPKYEKKSSRLGSSQADFNFKR